jgi:cytochrome d ubiquinol oxidase subunit I
MSELSSLANANAALPMTILGIYIHGFFLILAVGLPYVVLIYEVLGIIRKDNEYLEAAKRTSVVWAISFGFGAVTGTLVEFGLVQIWSGTILAIGSFFFIPLYLELFAFLIEVTFLAAYLYTWNKIKNPWMHWLLGLGILLGSNASAWLILTVNSWMQTPWGTGTLVQKILPWTPELGPSKVNNTALVTIYNVLPKTGSIVLADPKVIQALGYLIYDPLIVLFNPNALATVIHTILATIIIAAFETASIYSYFYLRGPRTDLKNFYFKAAKIAYGVGGIGSILMPFSGDFMARIVYQFQYVKFLIMEGFNGGKDPLIGLLTEFNPSYNFPGFKDLMSTANKSIDPNAVIQTLTEAQQMQPLMTVFYYSMVISGITLFLFGIGFFGLYNKKINALVRMITRMPTNKFIIYSSFIATILSIIAASAGWAVREIGRHPWTIYGLVQYQQVITPNPITSEFSMLIIAIELLILISGLVALYFIPTKSLNEIEIVRGG